MCAKPQYLIKQAEGLKKRDAVCVQTEEISFTLKKTYHKNLSCNSTLHPNNGTPVLQNAYSSMVDKKRERKKKESKKGKRRKKQKVENNQDGHGHAR